jgi:hypothetical protein
MSGRGEAWRGKISLDKSALVGPLRNKMALTSVDAQDSIALAATSDNEPQR